MTIRERAVAAAIGVAVATVGLVELTRVPGPPGPPGPISAVLPGLVFVLTVGCAVGAARLAPGAALGAAWTAGFIQLVGGVPVLLTEASLIVVLFAAARWGRPPTVLAAAASVGLVPILAVGWARTVGLREGYVRKILFDVLGTSSITTRVSAVLLGFTALGVPFLAGLALRFLARAQTAQAASQVAERDAYQANEIARLQEAQNRLARDVHDVVGHSLTVILAQAESAQFIEDPGSLKQTMQTIANSARASLQDVRHVLTPGQESSAERRGGLDTLIETVRASGHPVESKEVGDARPLPPELDAVAYRVLQEMLTNAIKHGRRDRPVLVERRWPERDSVENVLHVVVTNVVDVSTAGGDLGGGQGIAGMRRRLESVGGTLDVRRADDPDDPSFIAAALVPVRPPSTGVPA